MKKQNLIRNFLIIAALVGGMFVSGVGNNVYADGDGGGTIGSGTRSGYLGSGNRAPATAPVEAQSSDLQILLDAFYELIF